MIPNYIKDLRTDIQESNGREYYNHIPALKHLKEMQFDKKITFFVGENGTGKSTLLEAIAVNYGFNPEGGSINFQFSSKDTHSDLYKQIRLNKGIKRPADGFFLRAESFYNVATEIEELAKEGDPVSFLQGYGGKFLHAQSHGESFLSIIVNRFRGKGIYLLDEPEAALSPQRQLSMLIRIHQLSEDSQFIIATHSPILLGIPGADIYSFDDDEIHKIEYEDTESYQVTKMFIEGRENMLRRLLE